MELDGFVRLDNTITDDDSAVALGTRSKVEADAMESRIEHALRWLLRRFVERSWIDRRLGPSAEPNTVELAVDS